MDPVTTTLLLLAIPLGILIGVGAGIIGMTAWPLIVPLFFVFAGHPLHESLLSSIMVDLTIAVVLSGFYVKRTEVEVDISFGVQLGAIAATVAILTILVSFSLLEQHSDLFKGGSTFVTLLLGCIFLVQGFRMDGAPQENTPEPSGRLGGLTITHRRLFAYAFVGVQGFLTGLLAMGGAMNIVLVLAFAVGFPLLRAVGTAMISTAITLAVLAAAYLTLLGFTYTILPIAMVYVVVAAVSCYVAVSRVQSIPEKRLRLLIGSVIVFAAIVAMIQVYLSG